jgi:hypothetical protein
MFQPDVSGIAIVGASEVAVHQNLDSRRDVSVKVFTFRSWIDKLQKKEAKMKALGGILHARVVGRLFVGPLWWRGLSQADRKRAYSLGRRLATFPGRWGKEQD